MAKYEFIFGGKPATLELPSSSDNLYPKQPLDLILELQNANEEVKKARIIIKQLQKAINNSGIILNDD